MSLRIAPAAIEHADAIGGNLRAGDWMEVRAMGYKCGRDALRTCMEAGGEGVTCFEDDAPIAAWGYVPDAMLLASTAYLWCFTTPAVERHKKAILFLSREFTRDLLDRFDRLESTVAPAYEQALRWTRWLGFKPIPHNAEVTLRGVLFVNIVLTKET